MAIESSALTWAKHYSEMGFAVIPFNSKEKTGMTPWTDFQERMPTESELEQWFGNERSFKGMALVTGKISGICVVDVDDTKIIDKIKELLPNHGASPLVQSQNGGWHLYFKHEDGLHGSSAIPFKGTDLRAEGGCIIVPPSPGYTWKREIKEDKSNLLDLSKEYILEVTSIREKGRNVTDNNESLQALHIGFDEGRRDQTIFHLANHLVKGGMPQDNIREFLHFFASHCDPPYPEKDINAKLQSALKREGDQARSVQGELLDWIIVTSGYWRVTEAYQLLPLLQPKEKQAARVAIARFVKQGLLEKHPTQAATYRRIENQIEEIDFKNATSKSFDLKWPFKIEQLVKIYPGDIAVIAGEPDSGKTTFLLNLVRLNMNQDKEIYYASSEFGGEALNGRLPGFEDIPLDDWNFHFFNRADAFQDIIQPDAINIIDYMEISDNFFQIAGKFKAIHDKLNKGVAIIATQKAPQSEQGRGGSFALEKPAVYLNLMDNYPAGQLIQILKAKDWADKKRNPKYLEIGFKIYSGCILTPGGDWYHPEKKGRK